MKPYGPATKRHLVCWFKGESRRCSWCRARGSRTRVKRELSREIREQGR